MNIDDIKLSDLNEGIFAEKRVFYVFFLMKTILENWSLYQGWDFLKVNYILIRIMKLATLLNL